MTFDLSVNLFTSYYQDKNPVRQKELDFCLTKNLQAGFDTINLLIEDKDIVFTEYGFLKDKKEKINCYYFENRPTFNKYLDLMRSSNFTNSINIIANSDIFFEKLRHLHDYVLHLKNKHNTFLALSRYDWHENESILFERADSQDTWIFYGNPKSNINADFTMGVAGCDNRLAHEVSEAGYDIINPCKSIKTFHCHNSNIRNYIDNSGSVQRVPAPYKLVNPTY